MWEQLPNHLKTGLAVALILVVGVAVAGFTLSFLALREVAANPITGWGANAWIFPLCVDAALVAAEVVYISVSMIRGINRALPFCLMVLFGGLTVWFNVERVPAPWRVVTATPAIAGIVMSLLLAYLLKAYARVTGRTMAWDAPPPAGAGMLTGYGPVPGALYRPDAWQTQQQAGQIGQPEGSKRAAVEGYLASLDAGRLATATRGQVAAELTARGVPVDETYAGRILGEWRLEHPSPNGGRRGKR
jgi:Protein of unknown function (DUF2637)